MADVKPPIGGKAIKINVAVGSQVLENQSLLLFEAMKMEMDLPSPATGTVKAINVKEGQQIDTETIIMVIE